MSSLLKRYIKQILRPTDFLWFVTLLHSHFLSLLFHLFLTQTCIFPLVTLLFNLSAFVFIFHIFLSLQLSHEMTFDEQLDHFTTKVCLVEVDFLIN